MPKIITTSELQRQIGSLLKWASKACVIVTSRGKPKMIMLPYFEENDEAIADYMEDFEMYANKEALQKEWQESYDSGPSDLVI